MRASHYFYDDPAFEELDYYWITIQSVNVNCYRSVDDLAEGTTGYVYLAEGSQEDPVSGWKLH